MRFARFMNWLRSLVGLSRKPIHYRMKAKTIHVGTEATLWMRVKFAWQDAWAQAQKQAGEV